MLRSRILRYLKILAGLDPMLSEQIKVSEKHFGSEYGGWTVATDGINSKSIIYSFGIGTDISFDLDLIKKYSLNIHAFDPTPKSLEWLKKQKITRKFKAHPWGIAAYDGKEGFAPPPREDFVSFRKTDEGSLKNKIKLPVYRLATIMKKLGHKRIDILKMDIEGFEYDVIDDILKSTMDIKQILIEFHHRFPGFNKKDTEDAIVKLNKAGYKIFNISDVGLEFSLIKS